MGDSIRMVATQQPKTELAKKVQTILRKGQTIPDDLAIECLQVHLMDMNCSTRGLVRSPQSSITLMSPRGKLIRPGTNWFDLE